MKKLLYVFAAFLLAGLGSCSKYETENGTNPAFTGKNGFTLNYYVNGSSVNTYATVAPEEGEDYINTLHLLFFKASSGGTGEFIEALDMDDGSGLPRTSIGRLEVDFDSSSKLNKSTSYNILMVANIAGYLGQPMEDWLATLEGQTENEVIQNTRLTIQGQANNEEDKNDQAILAENLVMSAILSKDAGQENVEAELVRMVSRFDVVNNASGYTLVSASIWNAFTETTVWESLFNDFSLARTERYYGVTTDANAIKGGLYAFENYVVGSAQDDKKTTCLIVGLYKNDDLSETVKYYRVNVNASNIGQQLKRNNAYSIKISRVKAEGAAYEIDAWSQNEFLLDVSINEWNVDNQGNIQYDGENILAVPISSIKFGYEAETVEYSIFTLGEGTLEISKEIMDTGLSAELVGNTLKVSCTSSVESRNGTIELRFGNLKSTITVTQTMASNQYIEVSMATIPAFPNTAGAAMQGSVRVNSSGPWTAVIYNGNFFTFQSGYDVTTQTGNDNDTFTLTTTLANPNATPNYAFVHITLDDNIEVSRTLVITQTGVGGFDLTPAQTNYSFTPEGETFENSGTNKYTISVAAADDAPWEVVATAGEENFTLNPAEGVNQFSVSATPNTTAQPKSASYRVRLVNSPTVYKDLIFTQNPHEITFSVPSLDNVATAGGYSSFVTVTSSKAWTAELVSNNGSAAFDEIGTVSMNGISGNQFHVYFPQLMTPNYTPTATVTVSIPGTDVQKSISVSQTPMAGKAIIVGTYGTSYGRLDNTSVANYYNYINKLGDSWRSPANFGPSGKVYVPSISFPGNSNSTNTVNTYDVYNINNALSTANGRTAKTWLEAADNHIAILIHETSANPWSSLVSAGYLSGSSSRAYIPAATSRKLNPNVKDTPIMKYLLETGPFTVDSPIDIDDVSFLAYNTFNYTVTSWQGTMVPIIMDPTNSNAMLLGVDPTLKIVYIGDVQMFSAYGNAANNWNGAVGTANAKFMNNLLAWITYTAQFGDYWLEQFR